MLDDHIATAVRLGNLLMFSQRTPRLELQHMPEEVILERMKWELKCRFGDYLVRTKVRFREHEDRRTGDMIRESEVYCFTREELEEFLQSIIRYPRITHANHMGLSTE